MTNVILSLYRVFFVDDNNKLWALFQDGRLCLMKTVPSFCGFSSDHTLLTGVEIDGRQTNILWAYANFQKQEFPPILSCSGYCYFPALLNTPHARIAFLRADLLNPSGTGEMLVYQRARKKYYLIDSFQAAMYPPFFSKTGSLYYISSQKEWMKKNVDETTVLYPKTTLFTLNSTEEEAAVYCEETVRWLSFKTGQLRQFIAFDVTALGFNETGDMLFFATHKQGRTSLYQYNKTNQEITLVLNHSAKITAISF